MVFVFLLKFLIGLNFQNSLLLTFLGSLLEILTPLSLLISTKEVLSDIILAKLVFFLNFINGNDLLDLHFTGPNFNWCNNRSGTARRWACLDHCLVNLSWYSPFNSYAFTHLPRLFSDHAHLLLTINSNKTRKLGLFRFDNYWLDYLGCHDVVRNAFNFQWWPQYQLLP